MESKSYTFANSCTCKSYDGAKDIEIPAGTYMTVEDSFRVNIRLGFSTEFWLSKADFLRLQTEGKAVLAP